MQRPTKSQAEAAVIIGVLVFLVGWMVATDGFGHTVLFIVLLAALIWAFNGLIALARKWGRDE